jgi:hypothetical protein
MTTNQAPETKTAAPKVDTGEVRKASFWISQVCIIIATILGVYLAANQGFKQALAYGNIQADKSNYHLRQSLRNEIAGNVTITRDYLKRIARGGIANRRAPFQLDTYVWDTMKYSGNTLETPADLLGANMDFMRQMNDLYAKIASGDVSVEDGAKRVETLLAKIENETLPKFDADINEIKARLAKQGVTP